MSRDDYKFERSAVTIHERCQCGAEFTATLAAEGGEAALDIGERTPQHLHDRWQNDHAAACEVMAKQIAPRLERLRQFGEDQAAKKAAQKARAQARKTAATG
jgi:hypothetical protein